MGTSPTSGPGGGAAAPTAQSQLDGNLVAIANTATGTLTWDFDNGPQTLLNIAAPGAPTIITAGIYAIHARIVTSAAMTAGGNYDGFLNAGNLSTLAISATAAAAIAADLQPRLLLTGVWYLAAGDPLGVSVTNHDGVASRSFFLTAHVQRIS